RHHRDVRARVLPHAQRADRLQPGDQDDQVDDDRQDRPADEEVGESHQLSSGLGLGLLDWASLLSMWIAAPLRSLNPPEVTTSSPGFNPETTETWSPRRGPSCTKRCSTPW